jgi:hypothetical protein
MCLGSMLVGPPAMVMSRVRMFFGAVMAPVSMFMRGFAVMMSGGLMMGRGVVMMFDRRMGG